MEEQGMCHFEEDKSEDIIGSIYRIKKTLDKRLCICETTPLQIWK
jgi:hypothetical protein